ncbi:uncharacterized protein K441DRAFT_657611 [Cenococcum geophilum 1.58]|uniref:uncharacterized protein n=1 Tax=Cenococcum geophilum 1.58 TaxID=794803 RepID=UPI00358EF7D0|nr:hypothetical protein K441DRAFT_657611 [Cenococcum geophilum 1.58]
MHRLKTTRTHPSTPLLRVSRGAKSSIGRIQSGLRRITSWTDWIGQLKFGRSIGRRLVYGLAA